MGSRCLLPRNARCLLCRKHGTLCPPWLATWDTGTIRSYRHQRIIAHAQGTHIWRSVKFAIHTHACSQSHRIGSRTSTRLLHALLAVGMWPLRRTGGWRAAHQPCLHAEALVSLNYGTIASCFLLAPDSSVLQLSHRRRCKYVSMRIVSFAALLAQAMFL